MKLLPECTARLQQQHLEEEARAVLHMLTFLLTIVQFFSIRNIVSKSLQMFKAPDKQTLLGDRRAMKVLFKALIKTAYGSCKG